VVIVTDAGNTASNLIITVVTNPIGEGVVEDFITLPLGPNSGCPLE
jgi:hypothetical protein